MTQKKTPMMQQYFEIKAQYPDCLLFFRLGDFYELFFEDARVASQALNLVLTFRGKMEGKEVPMCGVPFHAYENYLVQLIQKGYKVAICEQLEKPEEAKKRGASSVVKRDVVRIVTSGTLTEDALLSESSNNFLTVIAACGADFGFAWADMSTGEFKTQIVSHESFHSVLERIAPAEIVVADNFLSVHPYLFKEQPSNLTQVASSHFNHEKNKQELSSFFNKPDSFFNYLSKGEIVAAGVLIGYMLHTQKGLCPSLLKPEKIESFMLLDIDASTRRSLEIIPPKEDENKSRYLLGTVGDMATAMGKRALSSWLNTPLMDIKLINQRLDKINFFIQNMPIAEKVHDVLRDVPDLDRALSRLFMRGGPRDMLVIATALKNIPLLRNLIHGEFMPDSLQNDLKMLGDHTALVQAVFEAIVEEQTPLLTRDGGFIKHHYHAPLDELRSIRAKAHQTIAQMQLQYAQKTGINTLKITYNNVTGFCVEVPARQAEPLLINKELGFVHRQTLTNTVRFTTADLAQLEQKVLHADELAKEMEIELFGQLREKVLAQSESIYAACAAIGRIDIACAQAFVAVKKNWVRPILTNGTEFEVKNARHPVVEEALKRQNTQFIPNTCVMGEDKDRLWILTGPNMAGKSTFLRQNALMVVLAQAGCFVPADYAKIGVVDRLFSRVGASDDLAKGQSTFMVEMVEVANILKNATNRSFVILDEVGRGTATFDGLSIAWAVVEFLHDQTNCRGLFATHYHELTALVNRLNHVSLHTLRVREWQGDIVFMHEVDAGAIDRSYGIHVAKLAGLPMPVLLRSEEILSRLEEKRQNQEPLFNDLPLFSQMKYPTSIQKPSPVVNELKSLDVDSLSPREALDVLYRLKSVAEE